ENGLGHAAARDPAFGSRPALRPPAAAGTGGAAPCRGGTHLATGCGEGPVPDPPLRPDAGGSGRAAQQAHRARPRRYRQIARGGGAMILPRAIGQTSSETQMTTVKEPGT